MKVSVGSVTELMSRGRDTNLASSPSQMKKAVLLVMFVNDIRDGQETFFYANGKTSVLRTYDIGDLHGAIEFYYENGQKAYEGNYYHGLGHGDFKKYDKSGKLVHKKTMCFPPSGQESD